MDDKTLERDIRLWKQETERIVDALTERIADLEREKTELEEERDDLNETIEEKDDEITGLNKKIVALTN